MRSSSAKVLAIAAVGLGLAGGCGDGAGAGHESEEPSPSATTVAVVVRPATRMQLAAYYVATATVRGRNTATITSNAMGHVRSIHVSSGDIVASGDLLVELDARAARAQVGQARAGVSEAEASVAQAEQDLEAARAAHHLAELTWNRMRSLGDAVTDHERDQAETALRASGAGVRLAVARLSAARARTSQAQAGQQLASAHLGDRRIVAPFAGRVVSRSVDVGDLAAPGAPLLVLEQQGGLRAEALVDESQAGLFAEGDQATVIIESLGREVEGLVAEVVPAVDVGSRAFVAKIDLPIELLGGDVRPGMFARVKFRTGTRERLVVPASAVSRHGSLERVFVAVGDVARNRLVTVGAIDKGWAELLSGITEGELVVVETPTPLSDGVRIEVRRGPAPAEATARVEVSP